ncbi:MAG: NFYB/HAP3 family transcription factor subunit [Candidatus Nanoarchaeia archaeon]|nr:NFYB/HAP3 family transcription factor subunit [Candidatus Nanoarchaeia archaeon]MDD5054495.1 NFYB/HAP3 family transcription factor subunit [Candidatus Nanoarchaeia archaeon]
MGIVSIRSAENLLKKAGCKRISVESCEVLRNYLENVALKLGQKAWIYSKHAKRRTLLKEDVLLAIDSLK